MMMQEDFDQKGESRSEDSFPNDRSQDEAQGTDRDSGFETSAEPGVSSQMEGEDDRRAWYVIHCYSGYENKVDRKSVV